MNLTTARSDAGGCMSLVTLQFAASAGQQLNGAGFCEELQNLLVSNLPHGLGCGLCIGKPGFHTATQTMDGQVLRRASCALATLPRSCSRLPLVTWEVFISKTSVSGVRTAAGTSRKTGSLIRPDLCRPSWRP